MRYATLTGATEEKALKYVYNHYALDGSKDGKDFMRQKYGFCGFGGFELEPGLSINAEMRKNAVKIIVADGKTVWAREYKWPEFLQKARDAKAGHQIDIFEMMDA